METTNYKSDVWKMKVKHLCTFFFFPNLVLWSDSDVCPSPVVDDLRMRLQTYCLMCVNSENYFNDKLTCWLH